VLDGIMGFIGPERMGSVSRVTAPMQNDPATVGL
jgi:hypothetical protein